MRARASARQCGAALAAPGAARSGGRSQGSGVAEDGRHAQR